MATTSPKTLCVFTGTNVVLPGRENPTPGTIRVDVQSGKIIDVTEGKCTSQDFPDSDFIDVGDKYILPGLVELVIFAVHASRSSPISAVLMCTLMNPGVPIGRASILEHELLYLEVSQPLWTCHSTRSRQRRQPQTLLPKETPQMDNVGRTLRFGEALFRGTRCAKFHVFSCFRVLSSESRMT
jgi:hypothetical protein